MDYDRESQRCARLFWAAGIIRVVGVAIWICSSMFDNPSIWIGSFHIGEKELNEYTLLFAIVCWIIGSLFIRKARVIVGEMQANTEKVKYEMIWRGGVNKETSDWNWRRIGGRLEPEDYQVDLGKPIMISKTTMDRKRNDFDTRLKKLPKYFCPLCVPTANVRNIGTDGRHDLFQCEVCKRVMYYEE